MSMLRFLLLIGLVLLAGCSRSSAEEPPRARNPTMSREGLSAAFCGLSVLHRGLAVSEVENSAFAPTGTSVAVLVSSETLLLVGAKEGAGQVTEFTDDTGRDLLTTEHGPLQFPYGRWAERDPGLGGPTHSLVLYSVRATPAPSARELRLKGTIVMRVANRVLERVFSDVAPRVGPVGTPADSIRITHVGPPTLLQPGEDRPYGIRLLLEGSQVERFVGLQLVDLGAGVFRNPNAAPGTIDVEIYPPVMPQSLTLQVSHYDQVSDVEVPLESAAGLGLRDGCDARPPGADPRRPQ
jgi:hypothetical protein